MDVVILENAEAVARVAADHIEQVLGASAHPVLGLATGSSPLGLYGELARRHRDFGLSFAGADVFMLDEYVGLGADHEQSYHHFIHENLVSQVDLDPARVHLPDGLATDLAAECASFDASIRDAGGVDCQLLGIGSNGHIAFNEPGSSLASRTRPVWLTPSTIRDNARFFSSRSEVPVRALSQGLGTIMEARRVLLIATGAKKADAVAQMVEGPVSARCPASVLQLHPHTVAVVDEDAAAKLELSDFYRYSRRMQLQDGAPAWS
ncbi:glucosamine-6-phosphate deaminase [Brachybacterium timonense]|uniref:glucosamine-6-phosphate deaminase n=1 Tax=Brachybacterium timonense TaxID=2050896 RepID=UPI000D0ACAD8|nr:glucosamine-6-phosphate deaminase [Brachybacterium timonense]